MSVIIEPGKRYRTADNTEVFCVGKDARGKWIYDLHPPGEACGRCHALNDDYIVSDIKPPVVHERWVVWRKLPNGFVYCDVHDTEHKAANLDTSVYGLVAKGPERIEYVETD